jgi:phosphinothricin acetyltransferase
MERRGPIAGIAVLVPVYKLSGFEGHVEDVVVDESFRGQGIGRQTMEQIIQHAHVDLGMKRLSLTSDPAKPARAAARALYAKLGFTEREGLFRLPLV